MQSTEIRKRFLEFFKARGHAIIPSAPLVPENDPTVLFNTAGMQPLVPYLMGRPHPQGDKLADIQKCVRTNDIDEVGDNTHLTFFEMMGNWSLGSYFKEDAIKWSYELLTNKEYGFGLDPKRLYVTVFRGDENVEKDEESKKIWMFAGIPENRIYFKGADANWWPAVKGKDAWTGPTGPCSEMFYDLTPEGLGDLSPEEYDKADDEQKVVEIWNDVFMEYEKKDGKIVAKLEKKNVDTGAGFERLLTVIQGKTNVFDTDIFSKIVGKIDEFTTNQNEKSRRIVADHIRSSVMLISDGVVPANADQGYILRRLLRRAVRHTDTLGMKHGSLFWIAESVIETYKDIYTNIADRAEHIKKTIDEEEQKFRKTLSEGMKRFEKIQTFSPEEVFDLYQSYGFPIELTMEMAKEKSVDINQSEVEVLIKKHQDLSRAGAEQKFKGGLGDTSEMSVKYHTATHLLHQALRQVLGTHVSQKGSNLTPERLRFDFTHPAKMTDEEKKKVEDIVNAQIEAKLPVQVVSLSKEEAEKTGALHFFGDKYGDTVTVYYIGNDLNHAFSKEFCGGPHVTNTGDLGKFKIAKEEAVAQGIRRIKAILE